jgi:hypothetical protein
MKANYECHIRYCLLEVVTEAGLTVLLINQFLRSG